MAISVINLQPNLNSAIAPTDAVSFDVDADDPLIDGFVLVTALFSDTGEYEVVHDGLAGGFAPRYAQGSVRTALQSPDIGFSYSIKRTGGWSTTPIIRVVAFELPVA